MAKRAGLGRGLGALIKDAAPEERPAELDGGAEQVAVSLVRPNPRQPRDRFDPDALDGLVRSIREHGVLQPLLVRKAGAEYELIAGERRWRAAQEAGLETVPVRVVDVPDRQALEIALIENLQREDLDPVEEAKGYQELADDFNLTQEQIAIQVGKARATVANSMRLLELPDAVKALLSTGDLSVGHAKILLGLSSQAEQMRLAQQVVREGVSVRALEKKVAAGQGEIKKRRVVHTSDIPAPHLKDLTERLHRHFGTRVRLVPCRTMANGRQVKGSLEIDFFTTEELDRLLAILGLTEEL